MARKHISRPYSSHRKDTFRPYDELYGVEIISFEHDLTQVYLVHRGDFKYTNAKKQSWKSWTTLTYDTKNNDKSNMFSVSCDYFVKEAGEYRIDIVYEVIYEEVKKSKEQLKKEKEDPLSVKKPIQIKSLNGTFMGESMKFEGTVNHIKRKELFRTFTEGNQTIDIEFSKNIYLYGVIVRKTKEFKGDSLDSKGTNLMLKKVSSTFSSQIAASEGSFEIAYDPALEHNSTSTGLYLDYNDEVNIYIKGATAKKETRVFGGYLSAIQADKDRTTLTVSCADRMVDGNNKFILTRMRLLGGATNPDEDTFTTAMDIDFDTYGQALKYLCNCLEITLNNNIGKNELVTDETAKTGFNIEFGKNKAIQKVSCKNASSKVSKNFIMIRNNAKSTKKQEIILYNGKDHVKGDKPVDITDYNNFGLVYGLGDKETVTEAKSITSGDGSSGAASLVGKQTFVIGVDRNNSPSDDIEFQSQVAKVLENAGHKTEKLSRAPGPFADYSYYNSSAKNKIGIYIIAAGTNSISDFYYGATKTGHSFKYCYFIIRGDLGIRPQSQSEFETARIGEDSDCSALCHKISGMTFPEMNNKLKDKVNIVFAKNGIDGGNGILNHLGGGSTTANEDKKTTKKKKKKKSKKTSDEEETEEETSTEKKTDLFKEISDYAFKHFRYVLHGDTCSNASCMQRRGIGDCWAFSEFIFNQFKKNKINCRVVQYATSAAPNGTHRSVQYMNSKKEWVDFPYREYGWGTKYNNMLNNTSGSKNPNSIPLKYTAGGTIEQGNGSGVGSSTTTTNVRTSKGYSRDKVIQGYFEITLSTKQSFKAKTTTVQVGFTQKPALENSITGFSPIWINNSVKQLNIDLLRFVKTAIFREDLNGENRYYLHSIKFVAPVNKSIDTEKSTEKKTIYKYEDWFTFDKSNHDYSSCKMDIYSINFNNSTLINPKDLDSCGKSVSSLFEELLNDSKYTVSREYGKHRCDDRINFAVDNKTEPKFVAQEGDDDNILEINGVSFTPRTTLLNNSTVVFKDSSGKYRYIETRTPTSILKYGEQMSLQTVSDAIGEKEAYYKALTNPKYNATETFNYTLVLPYFVDIKVGDLIQTIANSRKLNTIKTVASVKYDCSNNQIPKVQTEIGCGELPIDLQIRKELREIRALAKKETTHFSMSAEPVNDDSYYVWDN